MNAGYIENGFIVDLSNARKTSEIIYELSRILDIPEAQSKQICLKLGDVDLSEAELISIRALVNSMNSEIEFINTTSATTIESANALCINVSVLENEVQAPDFEMDSPVSAEVENALDKIFGDTNFDEEDEKPKVTELVEASDVDEIEEEDSEEIKTLKKEAQKLPTLYIKKTVRSGQSLKSDGNLFIMGDVNPGGEVVAKGDITVWGVLGGIAHAGSEGNNYARIRALKMNAIQLRIGEFFARRPDGVNTPFVQKSDEFVPEEARVYKKNIVVNRFTEKQLKGEI